MILAYQEIDIGVALEQLTDSDLPNLMAISFVFISIAVMLAATGYVVKSIRKPSEDKHIGIDASVLKSMIENNAKESKQRHDEIMLLTSGMTTIEDKILKKADDIAEKSGQNHQSVRASIDTQTIALESNTESVRTMSEKLEGKFDAIEEAVNSVLDRVSQLPDQIELSKSDRAALVSEIANELKSTMKQCLKEAIKTTQETPIVTPKTEIETKIEKESTDGTKK